MKSSWFAARRRCCIASPPPPLPAALLHGCERRFDGDRFD